MATIGSKFLSGLKTLGSKVVDKAKQLGQKAAGAVNKVVNSFTGPSVRSIGGRDYMMAVMAGMAYSGRGNYDGWKYESSLSDEKRGVWTKGTEMIIAFRGTEIDSAGDLIDDAKIVAGRPDAIRRAAEGADFVNRMKRERALSRIYITGHSLGGAIVMNVLQRVREGWLTGWAYNPGVVSNQQSPQFTRLRLFHVFGDPISAIGRTVVAGFNKTYLGRPGMNAHTIKQFTG